MSRFLEQLSRRVLVLDGAMGTSIHSLPLSLEGDYRGKENCTEVLVLSRPDVIQGIHESFLAVGADAVETDTFGANKLVLAEFDLTDETYEINKRAGEIARAACDRFTTPDRPRFVVGSIGPGTKLLTLGFTGWDTMFDSYREQARGLLDGGCDVLLVETAQDVLQVKCAINACLAAMDEKGVSPAPPGGTGNGRRVVPIMAQVTIESSGTMLLGTEIAAAAVALGQFPILSLGMNCATGPTEMAEHVRWLGRNWPGQISVLPNAGLPVLVEGRTEFPLKPAPFAAAMKRFVEECGVNLVGGCCGTTPEHIKALVDAVGGRAPSRCEAAPSRGACCSLYSPTEFRQDTSILNIGERLNASGSRAFKKMLEAEDWDAMVSLAREQMREGSHVLDINVDYAGRDNARDMGELVAQIVQQVNGPLMLDSTQPATLEAGLKRAGGKCILNSANLEDGEEKFARMLSLAKRYGSAIVLGAIDEDKEEAMARTADRKIAIARRMHGLATREHGLDERDLFFDPLVLPISTGMEKDRRSALETIEGTRRIATEFPNCQITCGLSNVSFGLKPAARAVLNSAFLHELIRAGMTSAIVHASKILPENRIPKAQWDAAMDLIYNRLPASAIKLRDGGDTTDPLQIFVDLFHDDEGAGSTTAKKGDLSELPLEERLQKHIIDGEKRGLIDTLDAARQKYRPLDIINEHLLAGMKVVGDLFGSGQMQLPFVLQSAEVMKMSVAHLEQFMEKAAGSTKGSIVLATVKGDVHDIGKNLVDIILSNNGYTVYNLGIKQPIAAILEKWRQTHADAIGLSGLLVKSVGVMKENLDELNAQGVTAPVLLGGAALSRHYCENDLRGVYKGRTYYGRDAFEGLRVMDLLKSGRAGELDREIEERLSKRATAEEKIAAAQRAKEPVLAGVGAGGEPAAPEAACPSCGISHRGDTPPGRSDIKEADVPQPPFFGSRAVEDVPLDEVFRYVNKVALFRGQWGFKKGRMDDADYQDQIDEEIEPLFRKLCEEAKREKWLRPKVVYGYFPCNADGDDLVVFDPNDAPAAREIERFMFPRQAGRQRLCISDFFRPLDSGVKDVLGLSCVTVGPEASRQAKLLFENHRYKDYLYVHGLGVETAEAVAEVWHKRMRQELGIADEDSPRIRDLFTQHYRGSRYSFGYPACPDMADQEKLFRLLRPERIGCTLSENWQIEPEQSTSALIVHHPAAKYFAV